MGCGTSCGSGLSGTGGGGGGGLTSINTGNTAWVDAVFGNDGTALLDRQDLPWLTIQAAVTAALAATPEATVVVRPGTYVEEVDLSDFVPGSQLHMVGVDRDSTILTNTGLGGTTLKMDDSRSVSNMTIIPAGGALTTGVEFDTSSLSSATLVNCRILGGSQCLNSVILGGTGNARDLVVNLESCVVSCAGTTAATAINKNSTGIARLRDVLVSCGNTQLGVDLGRGFITFEDCHLADTGTGVSLNIRVNGTARLDNATRWDTLVTTGTMEYDGTGISPEYGAALGVWVLPLPTNLEEATDRMAALLFANFGAIP